MVSKAREDLPEPERPVITTSLSRGISTSTFLRLCSRAPLTTILFIGVGRRAKRAPPEPRTLPEWRQLQPPICGGVHRRTDWIHPIPAREATEITVVRGHLP